jgi:protein SCO1/2|tara:strand:+ start:822 stop:1385 length:564 start_codon:yes stop_codon:yes gene_type:complete
MVKLRKILTTALLILSSSYAYAMPDVSRALSDIEFKTESSSNTKLDVYEGKIILLFFGYTNCPDICPTTLLDISKSLKELGEDSDKVQAVFVSVDPQRDTPKHLNDYVKYFDKRIVGLSSDKTNIDKLHKYFRTTYELLNASEENYLVEHSSNLYIIDENMVVDRIIANGLPSSEITKAIRKLINRI